MIIYGDDKEKHGIERGYIYIMIYIYNYIYICNYVCIYILYMIYDIIHIYIQWNIHGIYMKFSGGNYNANGNTEILGKSGLPTLVTTPGF